MLHLMEMDILSQMIMKMIFLFRILILVKVYIKILLKRMYYKKRSGKKLEADVVEIIERAKTEFVGVLQNIKQNFWFCNSR